MSYSDPRLGSLTIALGSRASVVMKGTAPSERLEVPASIDTNPARLRSVADMWAFPRQSELLTYMSSDYGLTVTTFGKGGLINGTAANRDPA